MCLFWSGVQWMFLRTYRENSCIERSPFDKTLLHFGPLQISPRIALSQIADEMELSCIMFLMQISWLPFLSLPPFLPFLPSFLFLLLTQSHSVAQAGVQCTTLALCNLHLLGSSDSRASASGVAGITSTPHHHAQLIFVLLVEIGFHHVDQDGLNLLTSWSTCLGLQKCWDYRREPPEIW